MNKVLSQRLLANASALALVAGLASVGPTPSLADYYMAGDFHNHTTCTDGSVSIATQIMNSVVTYELEWMAQVDHGGTGTTRDCRFDDPEFDSSKTGTGRLWEQTIGAAAIKGDVNMSTSYSPDGATHRNMWRWQMIQEIVFPEVAIASAQYRNPMIFVGLETVVPGHEHTSTTVLGNQKPWNWGGNTGDASAQAEFEYRWDRGDSDTSAGAPNNNWPNKIATVTGAGSGTANHNNKAVPSVAWMQQYYPVSSYYVPAHVERAGVFNPNGNNGFNVEHFRDFNNAGPTVAVGFETQPGHQAAGNRGEYRKNFCGAGCDSVGVTTYGGTGIYGAQIGGLWDALLGEGRNWFFYASSDWHHRGTFSPYVRQSTQDFYPGEYQKLYIPRPGSGFARPQAVVDGVRAGNSFSVMGDLITNEFTFTAEVVNDSSSTPQIARMGDTLVVPSGSSVKVTLEVNLPTAPNNSPYSFNNPSLLQGGLQQPLNQPLLHHVDFIKGNVTGIIAPTDPNYTNATNSSAAIFQTWGGSTQPNVWTVVGHKRVMTFTINNVTQNQYIRARGTNLPQGTQAETDPQGNPLNDFDPAEANTVSTNTYVPCTDPACPAHMALKGGAKISSYDVAAWADLWFYTNPIFIRVAGTPKLRVEENRDLARALANNTRPNTHDYNGDYRSDITFRDTGTGMTAVWFMNAGQVASSGTLGAVPTSWAIAGQRDFNGDGKADWVWRDTGTGDVALWFLNGAAVASSAGLGNVPTSWSLAGTSDFDGNRKGDLLWRHSSGNLSIWLLNGSQVVSSGWLGNVPTAWSIAATADFDGDGKADILWRDNSGNTAIWFLNGTQVASSTGLGVIPGSWMVEGTGDFNGDGKADLFWRDTAGNTAVCLMNGPQMLPCGSLGVVPTAWTVSLMGDYNGDGNVDILWRDGGGNTSLWLMNGTQVASTATLGNVPLTWAIQRTNAE